MSERVRCSNCGATPTPEQRFCGSCGTRLELVCRSCGASSAPGFRFCGSCGQPLGDAADRIRGQPSSAEERKRATILFADLSGFTALSERTDPEDVREIIDRCLGKLGAIVDRFGGTVNQVMGDGIMALFGAPVAHEDDPERAVRAALEMQRCAAEQAEEFGGLPLRVGVNTGEVLFAPVGPEGKRDQTVLGDAANVASRLQNAAPSGGILVGEQTYAATRSAIAYELVAPLELKGKSEPVPAWLARETMTLPAARPVSAVSMVGREHELDLLRSIWVRVVHEERPHLVTVLGHPGIGKTRLYREFARAVGAEARILHGRSLPYGESTGYGAFAQQVKQLAGITETDPATIAHEKLSAAVGSLLPDSPEIPSYLRVLLGLDPGTGSSAESHLDRHGDVDDPIRVEQAALLIAVRAFVEALGRRQPTVLVFEDIHWADASLCQLLETLAATIRDAPVLLLTLARPELLELRPRWGGGLSAYTAVPLHPLSTDNARRLAVRLLPELPDADTTAARLAEAAGGNPLFLEEFAATLAEGAEVGETVPAGVNAIIAARIDALPPAERQLILLASVVGKVFWRGVLHRLSDDGDVDGPLAALEARDLFRRETSSRIGDDDEYTFKHMLIREVAYATLPRAARRARHADVARFIEDAAGDRVGEWASLLAHHWREARERERSVGYFLMAAESAARAWARTEAVSLYSAALELIEHAATDRRRAVRLRRALTLVDAGDYATARPELDELLPELNGRDLATALLARGRASFWLMDAQETFITGRRALDLAESISADDLRSPALALVARGHSMVEDVATSTEIGEEALTGWQEDFHTPDLVFHLGQLATEYIWIGKFARAAELAQHGFDLAVKAQIVEAVFAGSALGMALTGLGRHDEAITHLERVVGMGREFEPVHAPRFTARTLNMLAGALREIDEIDRAREMNLEAIELGTRSGFLHPNIQGGIDLLYLDLAAGDVAAAGRAWSSLWEDAHKELGNFYPWLVQGRLAQANADIALARADPHAAISAADDAIVRARRPGRTKYEALARTTKGAALRSIDRLSDAIVELRAAASLAASLAHPPTTWHTMSKLGSALAAAGRDDAAAESYASARQAVTAFAETLSSERRARFLARPPIAEILRTR